MMLRFVAALLCSYMLSRLVLRAPLPGRGLPSLLVAHGLSAAVLVVAIYELRQTGGAVVPVIVAQGAWLLLDALRGRGVMARAA